MGLLPTGTADWLAFETRGVVSAVSFLVFCWLLVGLRFLGFGFGVGFFFGNLTVGLDGLLDPRCRP